MTALPTALTVEELGQAYRTGELDPVAVARDALDRARAADDELFAFIRFTPELALADAARSARELRTGDARPLAGVPVVLKDIFPLAGYPTTYGSRLCGDQRDARDGGVARRLRAAGAVVIGKTNTAEFGQSATTENRLGPPTVNPHDVTRTAGGSSGGSAAAVAAGLAVLGIGSDGGGSVRIPAAFTGLVGVKPTVRLCPDEHGLRAMSPFVTPGVLARTVADARVALEVMVETRYPSRRPARLQIAVDGAPGDAPLDPAVRAATDRAATLLAELGHHVTAATLGVEGWAEIFGPLVVREEHQRRAHLLERADQLTDYERRSIEAGAAVDDRAVEDARARLSAYRRRFATTLGQFDAWLTPTTAVGAFPVGQRPDRIDGHPVDRLWGAFPFTAPINVAGSPAVSLPCGTDDDGMPLGVQLLGPTGGEGPLLDLAAQLEQHIQYDITT